MPDDLHNADDGTDDPFRPPDIPTDVQCLHCGEEYQSYLIEYRSDPRTGKSFWCCPTVFCGGVGFGFDILPTDPEQGGWVQDDDGEDDDDLFAVEDEEDDENFLIDDGSARDSKSKRPPFNDFNEDDIPF